MNARVRKAQPKPGKAVIVAPAIPLTLPQVIERVGASIQNVDDLAKLLDLKRQAEADAERRRFDEDFAALQAEIGKVVSNAVDRQGRAYADVNALTDAIGPLVAAKGFGLTFDVGPMVDGMVPVTAKLFRAGAERTTTVAMPVDGTGPKGGAVMSLPHAMVAATTYGRRVATTLMFNLSVGASQQRAADPQPAQRAQRPSNDDPPPWDANDGDHLAALKRAAQRSEKPPSDKQIEFLADLLRKRGEPASAVLDDQGRLSGRDAWQAIDERKGGRA